jgi:hypothetical protein
VAASKAGCPAQTFSAGKETVPRGAEILPVVESTPYAVTLFPPQEKAYMLTDGTSAFAGTAGMTTMNALMSIAATAEATDVKNVFRAPLVRSANGERRARRRGRDIGSPGESEWSLGRFVKPMWKMRSSVFK